MSRGTRAGVRVDRLGLGELLTGASSVALLAVLFGATWFRTASDGVTVHLAAASRNGWSSVGAIDALTLVVCALGLAVLGLGASRRSPALPIAITVVLLPLAVAEVLALMARVLVKAPTAALPGSDIVRAMQPAAGAYLGVALSAALALGVYLTLRREGTAQADAPRGVEAIDVAKAPSAGRA